MDLNVKIIEGVRQCPILYEKNYSLEERSRAWLQLAIKLKIKEQYLKVRWHYLLQRYQQEVNFRYASKMNFLPRNLNTHHAEVDNWPEFIITEEDLKEENPEEKVEFHYIIEDNMEEKVAIQKDDDDDNEKDTPNQNECTKDEEITNATAGNHVEEEKTNIESSLSLKIENKIQTQADKDEEENCAKSPTKLTDKMEDMNMKKTVEDETVAKESANLETDSAQENNMVESVVVVEKDKPEAPKDNSKLSSNERCEDVIFGELVSAMLKRMDESKKNSIKKEIMNLLFS